MKNTLILIRRKEIEHMPSVTQMVGAGFRVSTAVLPKHGTGSRDVMTADKKKPRPENPDGEKEKP